MPLKKLKQLAEDLTEASARTVRNRYIDRDKGGLRYKKLAKDVMFLKSMINAEKNWIEIIENDSTLGQVNAAACGLFVKDITPLLSTGDTQGTRTGNSIKLHSSFIRAQIRQQSGLGGNFNFRWMICQFRGPPQSARNAVVNSMYRNSTFITAGNSENIIDYNAPRNSDFFWQFKVLRSGRGSIPCDGTTSVSMIKELTVKHRWFKGKGHHIRYDGNTGNVSNGQIVFIMLADTGNVNAAVPSTVTGIATGVVSSGCSVNFACKHYYYDN